MLTYWLLQIISMAITAALIPRLYITSLFGAGIIVAAIALVNATVWDAALFFQLPESFSLHALTLLLANGILFWVLVKLLPGIEVVGILPAILAPVVFTITSLLIAEISADINWEAVIRSVVELITGVRDRLLGGAPVHPLPEPANPRNF